MHGVYVEWFLNLPSFFANVVSNSRIILDTFIIIIIIIIIVVVVVVVVVHGSTYIKIRK